jgi:hypothetical protein
MLEALMTFMPVLEGVIAWRMKSRFPSGMRTKKRPLLSIVEAVSSVLY